MSKIFRYSLILSLSALFVACSSEDDIVSEWVTDNEVDPPSSGTLDFTKYVAVGNSLTAGFADGALFPEGQANSFPSILAAQLAQAGGGSFVYPDISSGNGFGGVAGTAILGRRFIDLPTALKAIAGDPDVEVADAIQVTAGTALNTSSVTGAGLSNFGVPSARLIDLAAAGYGAANPFFGAFQSSATASIVGDAASAGGTFFTLWAGSNDVLGYAIDGGAAGETSNPLNPKTITDAATFTAALKGTLDALSAGGAEGVLLNVPPVTIIPFFQTVTTLGGGIDLIPLDAGTAGAVTAGYATYNATLDALVGHPALPDFTQTEADWRKITFAEGDNPPVITDESLTDLTGIDPALLSMRQAKMDPATGGTDLFGLTALSVIGAESVPGVAASVYGVGVPVPDENTLTLTEQGAVIMAYAAFNGIIAAEAEARENITLVDVGPMFADIYGLSSLQAAGLGLSTEAQAAADGELGILVGGIDLVPLSLTQEAIFNSVWSADGVHPNPRGSAILVNEIIGALNAKYGSSIPTVNPLDFPGINAPF
ncbi:MAG: hypothetical protein ABJG78_03655 [Cyclobacteriaceae bacterium]